MLYVILCVGNVNGFLWSENSSNTTTINYLSRVSSRLFKKKTSRKVQARTWTSTSKPDTVIQTEKSIYSLIIIWVNMLTAIKSSLNPN